ncbi:MAG: methionine--tRNA ligase [Thermoplasmata archaeon]|nr:methionine--tRNA ligase [Thermoplasmata archaeon]
MERIFVGIAWPYANGPFHVGHLAGAYLPGDAFARYHRLRGHEVLMVSGSDMHGTPTLVRAESEGATPEQIARRFHAVNKEAFERLGFTFDLFTDTHTLVHERTVQELFLRLLENGHVHRRTEENAYCPKHARFLPDRYLLGTCPNCGFEEARGDECDNCGRRLEARDLKAPRCSLCGTPAVFRPSEHFYLGLDGLAKEIHSFLASRTEWRPSVAKVAANFENAGLRATPITRDLEWGIPIPLEGYETKRFYVWFDALIGYLSASKEWAIRSGHPDAWRKFWTPGDSVRPYYFIGKDNTFHHTILWPGILLGVGGLPLPYDVPANEWLVIGGKKLAKSRGRGADVFIPSLLAQYSPDHIRFYAALLAPQNHDTELDWDEFHRVHDEILANQYGNLVQRLLVLARDREAGRVPTPAEPPADLPSGVGDRIRAAHEKITAEFERVHLKEALELALTEIREGNKRFHDAKPWQAADEDRRRAVFEGLWLVHAAAVWLSPFLPFSSKEVWRMLGHPRSPGPGDWDEALNPPKAGQALGEPRPIFPRLEQRRASPAEVPKPSPSPSPPAQAGPAPLEIRVGQIREVTAHPTADRLYVLTVDLGEPQTRTLVAGIRAEYRPEELTGRRIAVLVNLEHRRIRSVTSEGMLLAVEGSGRVLPLAPPEGVAVGAAILGTEPGAPTISHDRFRSIGLRVGRVVGAGTGGTTAVDIGGRVIAVPGAWTADTLVVVRTDSGGPGSGAILAFSSGLPLSAPAGAVPGAEVR